MPGRRSHRGAARVGAGLQARRRRRRSGPTPAGWGRTRRSTPSAPERAEALAADLVQPTLDELRRRGIDYRGVLYAGLMLTDDGPKVLEYNVRFGDPEAQVVLPRLDSDLAALLPDVAAGGLRSAPRFRDDAAVTVVCASEGYPHAPRTGDVIDRARRGPRRRRRERLLRRCRPGPGRRARHVRRAGPERHRPRPHPRSGARARLPGRRLPGMAGHGGAPRHRAGPKVRRAAGLASLVSMAGPVRGRAVALLVALPLVAIALLVSVRHVEPTSRSARAAVHDAHVTAVLPAVIRDLAPRASLPDFTTRSSAVVVIALGALLGLVALAAPRAIGSAAATGLGAPARPSSGLGRQPRSRPPSPKGPPALTHRRSAMSPVLSRSRPPTLGAASWACHQRRRRGDRARRRGCVGPVPAATDGDQRPHRGQPAPVGRPGRGRRRRRCEHRRRSGASRAHPHVHRRARAGRPR